MDSSVDWSLVGLMIFMGPVFVRMGWLLARELGSAGADQEALWERVDEERKQPSAEDVLKYAPEIIRENLTGGCTAEELMVSGREDDIADAVSRASFFLSYLLEAFSSQEQFSAECVGLIVEDSADPNRAQAGFCVLLHETGFLEYDSDEDEYAFSSEFLAEVTRCAESRGAVSREINPIDLRPEFFV